MRITRRDFMKYCAVAAGALGLSTTDLVKLEKALATPVSEGGTQVVWLNGASCTGCTVSLANTAYYSSIQDLLVPWIDAATAINAASGLSVGSIVSVLQTNGLSEQVPTNGPLDVVFMETLSSAVGSGALNTAKGVLTTHGGTAPFVLCIEGAIQTAANGNFCMIGDSTNYGTETISFKDEVLEYALDDNCLAILAVGTCASFGGIPAAKGSVTGARGLISTGSISGGYTTVNTTGLWDSLKYFGAVLPAGRISMTQWTNLMRKTICISGCPPHPDWIVGTIVYLLSFGEPPLMDKWHRPLDFYGQYQCDNCLWQTNVPLAMDNATNSHDLVGASKTLQVKGGTTTTGNSPYLFLNKYNSPAEGCIGVLGCKGRKTKADCSYRRWNADAMNQEGTGWCVQTRGGCHGCTEPRFPDGWGKFFTYK